MSECETLSELKPTPIGTLSLLGLAARETLLVDPLCTFLYVPGDTHQSKTSKVDFILPAIPLLLLRHPALH
eukprot:3404294-Rhodomonas_salina.2